MHCINPGGNSIQDKGGSRLMESSLDCVRLSIQVKGRGQNVEMDRPIA